MGVTELQRLEMKALQLVRSINLKPTLDRAAELGGVLSEVKGLLPHGHWLPWLKRVGLNERTAQRHVQVFREFGNASGLTGMTIEQFLTFIRRAKYSAKWAEREAVREVVAQRLGKLPDAVRIVNKDCRKFDWPDNLDAVVTDPPWADMGCYRWLATMAAEKLRDGGLLLVQCSQTRLPDVMAVMTGAGLRYWWTLAIVLSECRALRVESGRFRAAWKPVPVFVKGETPRGESVSDVVTVREGEKDFHDWQQPEDPFRYWLSRLLRPGSLVGDPFAGSGTTGVVCRKLAMRWVGTEKDVKAYKVARGRLVGQPIA